MPIYANGEGQFGGLGDAAKQDQANSTAHYNQHGDDTQEAIHDVSYDVGKGHYTVGDLQDMKSAGKETSIRGASLARGVKTKKEMDEKWEGSVDQLRSKNNLQRGGSGVIKAGALVKGSNGYLKNALLKNKDNK